MSMMDRALRAMEAKLVPMLRDRMEVRTEIDEKSLTMLTATYFDGELVMSHEMDLRPLIKLVKKST